MFYRMYLYKSRAFTGDSPIIAYETGFITEQSTTSDCESEFSDSLILCDFDAQGVLSEIRKTAESVGAEYSAEILYTPSENKPYICVTAPFESARCVKAVLIGIAVMHELTLFDKKSGKTVFHKDLFDDSYWKASDRAAELNTLIQMRLYKHVWRLRMLYNTKEYPHIRSYTVTFKKKSDMSLEEQTALFVGLLRDNLKEGEELLTGNERFAVESDVYRIEYCVEGYKKSANYICYADDGDCIRKELMKRMSTECAVRWIRDHGNIDVIRDRMNFDDLVWLYPNPAERFVASVRISKRLSELRGSLCVEYGKMPFSTAGITFRVNVDTSIFGRAARNYSYLNIEEDTASFILPVISEAIPYIYDRYYSVAYIMPDAMNNALEKLKEIKKQILSDTYNPSLAELYKQFDLYMLLDEESESYKEEAELMSKSPADFVYKHRHDIAALYDIFTDWAEIQSELCIEDEMSYVMIGL